MKEKNKPETPRCEFKGTLPHPARPAYLLVWNLPSGPVVKWSCAEHRHSFGGNRGYWVNRTEGYEDNRNPRSHELAAGHTGRGKAARDDGGRRAGFR
jgi:hypothetical protein